SNYAKELNKRIIPIVAKEFGDMEPPKPLRELQYLFFTDETKFHTSLHQLVTALNLDIDWIREHTRLGELARQWDHQGRYISLLLWGDPLKDAERWLAEQPDDAPKPDELLRNYIKAGRRMARWRRRIAISAVCTALIIALSVPAYFYPKHTYMMVMRWPRLLTAYSAPSDKIDLSQSARTKASEMFGVLTEELRRSFMGLRKVSDASFTPWAVAQYSVALREEDGPDREFLSNYFHSRLDQACN